MNLTLENLKGIQLLSGLPDNDLRSVQEKIILKGFKKGSVVVQKGQPSSELYFLIDGRLKVIDYSRDGREIGFMFIEKGNHFGELALIDGKPRSASIIAAEACSVAFLSKSDAQWLIYNTPSVSEKLLKQLAHMVRQTNEHVVMLGNTNAMSRICIMLIKLADNNKAGLIHKPPTQTELAAMTNTTRETVSRTLSILTEKGLIKKQGKQLEILNTEKLKTLTFE